MESNPIPDHAEQAWNAQQPAAAAAAALALWTLSYTAPTSRATDRGTHRQDDTVVTEYSIQGLCSVSPDVVGALRTCKTPPPPPQLCWHVWRCRSPPLTL